LKNTAVKKRKHTAGTAERATAARKVDLQALGDGFHDTQRQLASAAFALQEGLVSEEDAAHLALVGTLSGEADTPYIPRATINQTKHRMKTPMVGYNIYHACVAKGPPQRVGEGQVPKGA